MEVLSLFHYALLKSLFEYNFPIKNESQLIKDVHSARDQGFDSVTLGFLKIAIL